MQAVPFCRYVAALVAVFWVATAQAAVPVALGSGFAADTASDGGYALYGPALGSVSGGGATFTNSARSELVAGNPTVEVTGTGSAHAQAILYWFFEVTGPADTLVPVDLTGTVTVTRSGTTAGNLVAVIGPANEALTPIEPMIFACFGGSDPECRQGSGTITRTSTVTYSVQANVPQAVFMFASIDALSAAGGSFRAFADPTVAINPAFGGAADYQLLFSPGVVPAVPEAPAAGALSLGLCALAARMRPSRRRQRLPCLPPA